MNRTQVNEDNFESDNSEENYKEKLSPYNDVSRVKSYVWDHFKQFKWEKYENTANTIIEESLRVYCQHPNCKTFYTHKSGGSTKNMKTHLKNHHKICSKEESVEVTDLKKEATEEQFSLILYYMVMFIVSAGLSFRTIEINILRCF